MGYETQTIRFEVDDETRFLMMRAKADYQLETHAELFEKLLKEAGYEKGE